MKVAFLGLGKMGAVIARLLLQQGRQLTVWNRTASHAEPLRAAGASVAATAAEAVAECDIVFTMLLDDASLEAVLAEAEVPSNLKQGAIHVSLSTLSVALSRKLTEQHAAHGQHFVAAPVFGRPHIAEQGKLWIAVGGTPEAVDKVRPLLEHCSRGITVVSENPWSAHALKLGGNFLITAMIAALSESFIYAEALGIEPGTFIETINSALFQSPFYEMYAKIMLHPTETPGASMAVGEKDMRLFRDAAHSEQLKTPLADVFEDTFRRAFEAGMKDQDWAAGYYRLEKGLETQAP
ncbi:MAG TPA: NAD(P)-dependent oxidoreductase [Acidobacteriaceae bacterium]